jgi:hypothetical protein
LPCRSSRKTISSSAREGRVGCRPKARKEDRGRSATANTSTMKPHWRPPSARLIERGSAR